MYLLREFHVLRFGIARAPAMRTREFNNHSAYINPVQAYLLVTFWTVGVLAVD
jgi:hypothetical protein